MVAHGIDFDQGRVVVLENASDVGVELAAFFISQKLTAALRAEHPMHDDVAEGLGHDLNRGWREDVPPLQGWQELFGS